MVTILPWSVGVAERSPGGATAALRGFRVLALLLHRTAETARGRLSACRSAGSSW
jgi:hypothetical protein